MRHERAGVRPGRDVTKEMGCVLLILTRDESAEDLRASFEMAHGLAVLRGAEELRVVRVVEIPVQVPLSDLDPESLAELLDPDSLINTKKIQVKHVWCARANHRIVPCRDAARCILDQVEEHRPAALVLMADDAGTGPLAERMLDRVLARVRVPTVVLHREYA